MNIESDRMFLRAMWTWFTLTCVHCARVAWYLGIVLFVVATVALTIFRYWLPALSERKVEIETFVSQQIGQQVRIGTMSADWRGLYPSLHVKDLVLHSDDGEEEKLRLEELSLILDLVPLLQGRFAFRQVTLQKPRIEVIRHADGIIRVGRLSTLTKRQDKPGRNIFDMMFLQQFVVIEDGIIEWRDDMLGEDPMLLSDINISLHNNKDQHMFDGTLSLPGEVHRVAVLSVELQGNPMRDNDWDGVVDASVSSVDFKTLPGIITNAMGMSELEGSLSFDLTTGWQDGAIDSASGQIEADEVIVPLGKLGTPVNVDRLQAQLSLVHEAGNWQLQLVDTWLAFKGEPWSAGAIKLNYQADEASMNLERIELEKLRPVLDAITSENKIAQLVKDLYPQGMAHDTRLVLYGQLGSKPRDFIYEMALDDVAVNAHKLYPSLTGVSGLISVNKNGGFVDATASASTLGQEKVYDKPLHVDRIRTKVTWDKGEENWHVRTSDMRISNEDADVAAQFHASIPLDISQQPRLELSAELRNGNLANADRYFPVRLLSDGMNGWLKQTKFRGRVNHLQLDYKGAVKSFPIRGADTFDVIANLSSASMNFLPGWPRVRGIEGDLVVSKTDLTLTGTATDLLGQRVDDAVVHLENLDKQDQQVINVSTALHGGTKQVVEFLRTGPLFKDAPLQNLNLAGSGQGLLSLKLSMPLRQPENNTVSGSYVLKQAGLQLPNDSWLTKLKGTLEFTDKTVSATGVNGRYLGGDINFNVDTIKPGRPPVVEIHASGQAQTGELVPLLGEWLVEGLEGSTAWRGVMHLGAGDPSLQVSTDMTGITSRFPAPLDKSVDTAWPLKLDAVFPPGKASRVAFTITDKVYGNLSFPGDQPDMPEINGCITIGSQRAQCPAPTGLDLAVVQPVLETTPWIDYLGSGKEGDGEWPDFMTRVSAEIESLVVSGVDMEDVELKLRRQPDGYMRGWVEGSLVSGEAGVLWGTERKHIELNLDQLVWYEAAPGYPVSTSKPDPLTFPALDIEIGDLNFHGMKLGRMTAKGVPTPQGWGLESMLLERPDMTIKASGRWRGSLKNHVSSFDVDFTSTDMLATLEALDVNTEMGTKDFHTTGYLSWADTPFDFSFGIMNGVLDISAGKGSLNSVEVGAGRLLGALNVDTLRRRLLLDFSDLFEEGFPFDSIESQMTIKLGQANVTKMLMPGPSATIRMEGRLGIVDEDIDMKMAISPAVGGNLAVAGFALGGPVGGVATYIAQKAIQKQMNKSANYRYHVIGSWEAPVVEKLASPKADQVAEEEDLIPGE